MTKKEFKEKYTEVQSLQGQNGNYNFDRYMLGLYNGMEMIIALYENREPNYINAYEINFLNDKQDNLQQRIDKVIEVLNEYKKSCESKLNFEKGIHSPTARNNETYWKNCIDKLNYILSILQNENVSKYVKN